MTTRVIVKAHCASTKEVKIIIGALNIASPPIEEHTIQDGQTLEKYVYDERIITVQEVLKK